MRSAWVAIGLFGSLFAGGCVSLVGDFPVTPAGVAIVGCAAVPRDTCMASAGLDVTLELSASIDAAYAPEYNCVAVVKNSGTSDVTFFEADVQVLDPVRGDMPISQYSAPITGFVAARTSDSASVGVCDVLLVDAATVTSLAQKVISTLTVQSVVASVVLRGHTPDGQEVQSNTFTYPINVRYASTCTDSTGTPCVGASSPPSSPPCRVGLDGPTDCQDIASALGVCHLLECATKGDLTTAHCPTHIPADDSCCP
jgi:hypothetical protein